MVNEGRLVNEKRRALVNDIYERYTTEIENSFVNTTICENNDLRSKRVTGIYLWNHDNRFNTKFRNGLVCSSDDLAASDLQS